MKKNLFCILVMTLLSCVMAFAQNGLYRVKPGDTFERIAKELSVSVQALKEANPSVKTLFVGMKLNIPAVTESVVPAVTVPEPSPKVTQKQTYVAPEEPVETKVEQIAVQYPVRTNRPTEALGRFSGGILFNKGEFVKNAFAMEFYFGSRFYVCDPMFLESGLAYGFENSWSNESDYKYDATSHSLQIPGLLGVSLGRDFGADFYVGPYLDFTVASKSEMEIFGEKTVTRLRDQEDYRRFQLGLRVGAEIDFDVFTIGVNYSLALTSRFEGVDPSGSKLMFYVAF